MREFLSKDKLKVSCLGQPVLLWWLPCFLCWRKRNRNKVHLFICFCDKSEGVWRFLPVMYSGTWSQWGFGCPSLGVFLRPEERAVGIGLKKSTVRTWEGCAWFIYLFTFRNAKYYLGNMCCGCKGRAVCLYDLRSGSLSLWTCHDFHPLPWRRECSIFLRLWLSMLYTVAELLCCEK